MGSMGQFQSFADTTEHHCMLTSNITSPPCLNTYLFIVTLTYHPFSLIDSHLLQIPIHGIGQNLGESHSGSTWGILLQSVVDLQNLHVIVLPEEFGHLCRNAEHHIDAHTHVRGHDTPDAFGQFSQFFQVVSGDSRRTNNHGNATGRRLPHILQGCLWSGKINDHITQVHDLFQGPCDLYAHLPETHNLSHIPIDAGMLRVFKGRRQGDLFALMDHMNNPSTHTTPSTGNYSFNHDRLPMYCLSFSPLPRPLVPPFLIGRKAPKWYVPFKKTKPPAVPQLRVRDVLYETIFFECLFKSLFIGRRHGAQRQS